MWSVIVVVARKIPQVYFTFGFSKKLTAFSTCFSLISGADFTGADFTLSAAIESAYHKFGVDIWIFCTYHKFGFDIRIFCTYHKFGFGIVIFCIYFLF